MANVCCHSNGMRSDNPVSPIGDCPRTTAQLDKNEHVIHNSGHHQQNMEAAWKDELPTHGHVVVGISITRVCILSSQGPDVFNLHWSLFL